MYDWRRLTPEARKEVFNARFAARRPWHSPPHRYTDELRSFIVSAACFEHKPILALSAERLEDFSQRLLATCDDHCSRVYAWCVLPNHYHVVVQTHGIKAFMRALGTLHGRTSYEWNGEENCRGRQVWFNAVERVMRSERHLWASINYVHHNPVKHGYVERWQDWAWSSAESFLQEVGRERAEEIWQDYPVKDYGRGWDD
jgi:putative transposase